MGDGQAERADDSGFDLFDRWLAHRDQEQAHVTGDVATDPAAPDPDPALDSPLFTDTSLDLGVVPEEPRSGAGRVVGLVLLVALAATAVAAYVAWQDRTGASVGIAGVLALLTTVVWAVRAGSAVTRLTVRGGQLEILRGGSRHQFDLTSRYTPVDIVGEPGSRGWKVLFHRRSMAPFVVDASMVDPVEFTRVVRHYRPNQD